MKNNKQAKKMSCKEILTEAGGKQATNKVIQFACFVAVIKNVCFGNFEFRAHTMNRPIRLTQCCTQFKPFGNKTFCFRNFHII